MTVPAFQPLRSRNQPGVRLPTHDVDRNTAAAWLSSGDRAQRRAAERWLRRKGVAVSEQAQIRRGGK